MDPDGSRRPCTPSDPCSTVFSQRSKIIQRRRATQHDRRSNQGMNVRKPDCPQRLGNSVPKRHELRDPYRQVRGILNVGPRADRLPSRARPKIASGCGRSVGHASVGQRMATVMSPGRRPVRPALSADRGCRTIRVAGHVLAGARPSSDHHRPARDRQLGEGRSSGGPFQS